MSGIEPGVAGPQLKVFGQPPTLAQRRFDALRDADDTELELEEEIAAACSATYGSIYDYYVDPYDKTIEVWGVMSERLDHAAKVLLGHGFAMVWLHQHLNRENCTCKVRT
jgi:hypothetical protein